MTFSPPDFKAVFESGPGLCLVLTPDFEIVAVSELYLRATMTARENIIGRGIFEIFPDNPDDPAATGVRNLRASLDRVLQTGRPDTMAVQQYDVRRPEHEGGQFEERHWSPVNSPVIGAHGEVVFIIHRVEDVTEFVQLKRAGREREEMTEALRIRAEQMEVEVYLRAQELAEANRRLSSANEELKRLYNQVALLMAKADDELSVRAGSEDRWDFLQSQITPEEMLARIGQLIAGHKNLEEQLRQSQKLEAVGRLAGGVAHDFNNLLTVISGYASLVRERLRDDSLMKAVIQIEKAAERATNLTKQLLAFSRKEVRQPKVLGLNEVVRNVDELLRQLIGENISLVMVLDPGLARVRADPGQIEQIIMNLGVNARDAMPAGGKLLIETRNIQLERAEIPRTLQPGPHVLLSVTDTGHGMDAKTIEHIFEPFFTTKGPGKGTGLGLSTVYGIVEQSGGALTVRSKPGEGAVFQVYLPAVPDQAVEDSEEETARVSSGAGTILVVEDEQDLRSLIVTVLSDAGFRVLEAATGEEALSLTAVYGGLLDLLLTDVVMPGMSGVDLAQRLHTSYPNMIPVFMSGYDRDLLATQASKVHSFLPKPFTPTVLLAKLTELLGSKTGAESKSRPKPVPF